MKDSRVSPSPRVIKACSQREFNPDSSVRRVKSETFFSFALIWLSLIINVGCNNGDAHRTGYVRILMHLFPVRA